jgi:hypothetical protein
MPVVGERRPAVTLESERSELELIAETFEALSKEISYEGAARALLKVALEYSRDAGLSSEGGERPAKADARFLRERARVLSERLLDEFRLPAGLSQTGAYVSRNVV